MVQPLWRIVWKFLKKLKLELPYDPAIPYLAIYLEKTIIWKDACSAIFFFFFSVIFFAALFKIAKTWKQSKYPSTEDE